tara:strand:+ start:374 stop:805 length:432 start_codon:yes stop_codon:yes gene_type:complete
MSDFFANKFRLFLEADDDAALDAPGAIGVAPEMEPQMGPDQATDMGTIDAIDDVQPSPVGDIKKAESGRMKGEIKEWIDKVEGFTEFLNGLDDNSLQSKLNNADCDTLFANVSRSETKKISRIAQDLSGLVESLKGHLLSSEE